MARGFFFNDNTIRIFKMEIVTTTIITLMIMKRIINCITMKNKMAIIS